MSISVYSCAVKRLHARESSSDVSWASLYISVSLVLLVVLRTNLCIFNLPDTSFVVGCSARNIIWKYSAETSEQINIWSANCEFSAENQYCTHLWLMRYRSNPLGHDCSWLIINLPMRLMYFLYYSNLITNQTICPVKCNFVRTKIRKMANCWMLFWALGRVWLCKTIFIPGIPFAFLWYVFAPSQLLFSFLFSPFQVFVFQLLFVSFSSPPFPFSYT